MADPVFGAMVGAHHVDEAILNVLQTWDRTYLQEVARRSEEDVEELKPFRGWRVSYEMEKLPEDQTPLCIIANQGLIEPPVRRSFHRPGQVYAAIWRYRIGVHISAAGRKRNASPRAQQLAKMYILALRTVLVQQRERFEDITKPSILTYIDWIDEDYGGLDSDADRTICLVYADFNVSVQETTTWGTGPKEPVVEPDPEIPTWPVVTTIIPEIIKVPTETTIDDYIEGGG